MNHNFGKPFDEFGANPQDFDGSQNFDGFSMPPDAAFPQAEGQHPLPPTPPLFTEKDPEFTVQRHEHVIVMPQMSRFHRFLMNSAMVALWAVIISGAVYFILSGVVGLMIRHPALNRGTKSYSQGSGRDESIPSFGVPGDGSGFSYDFGNGSRDRDEDGGFSPGNSNAPALKAGLGVTIQPFTPQTEKDPIQGGRVIAQMNEHNAFAGTDVKVNDIITAAEGSAIKSFDDLRNVLGEHQAGDRITVTIARYTGGVPELKDYEAVLVSLE